MARRRLIASLAAALLLAGAGPAAADSVVTSAASDAVAVTIYPAPDRRPGTAMDLDWLEGYALITETRTVAIPAGDATIRFEGVAGGMLPESALVTGLPAGVREKNLDADLLSPASLYARSFGRPVILRRLHPKTGKTVEERAIIRSGPDGSVLLQTREGFEAANCGPLNDSLVYPGVPAGLSARPTLSVATHSATAATVTLSLSYLAWGFDWQADYVLRMGEDDQHGDLNAWVTLASSDPTSFVDADVSVVAGKINRTDEQGYGEGGQAHQLVFHCLFSPASGLPPPAPPPPPGMAGGYGDIIVTAQRRAESLMSVPVTVSAEELGDLKRYRMPIPTTLASNSQKQVALFAQRRIKLAMVYYSGITYGERVSAPTILLRTRNETRQGLGLALPMGPLALFEPLDGEPMYVSGSGVRDNAIGEMLELPAGRSNQVSAESLVDGQRPDDDDFIGDDDAFEKHKRRSVEVTVRNANPWPVDFEASINLPEVEESDDEQITLEDSSARLGRKYGQPLWQVRVPANGTARLRYKLRKTKIG